MTTERPTGVLLMAYGTPDSLDDVEAYYTHIRAGRTPSPEAVERLRERYRRVGGRTPLLDVIRNVADSLQSRLEAERPGAFRTYVGMKHWRPFIEEVVPRMAVDGVGTILGLPLAPHASRLSTGTYRQAVEQALDRLEQPPKLSFVEGWQASAGFRRLVAERVQAELRRIPQTDRQATMVLFSAHSLPRRILEWDDPYPRQLQESAAAVAALAGVEQWRLVYQSAGMTPEPWLGPDILEALQALAAEGTRQVVSVPFGFVADHLEILYDLDVEAQARASELGLTLRRIRLPNADPEFIEVLASLVREASDE